MELARVFDNKKFMWDGKTYDSETESHQQLEKYSADGFEVKDINENGKYYVFTRRVINNG
ncbi:MAG: hypothetical protein ACRKGH_01495 [Dehalogenimonas sp.]